MPILVLLEELNEAMYEKAFCKALAPLLLLHRKSDCSAMRMWVYNMNYDPIKFHLGHP